MKHRIAAACITLLLIAGLFTPALAQRASGEALLRGRIVEANTRSVQISWYYQAASKNDKGVIPDEIARQIADMQGLAQRLRQQGKQDRATQLQQHIERLQLWREVQQTITDWKGVEITGLCSKPLSEVKQGMKLRMTVGVDRAARGLPTRGTLVKHAEQVEGTVANSYRRLPAVGERLFLEVVGNVAGVNPLTLDVNGEKMQIDNPERYRFVERGALTQRDLRPGCRVITNATLDREGRVRNMRSMTVYLDPGNFDDLMPEAW